MGGVIRVLYGDEPYCIQYHKKKLLAGIDSSGMNYTSLEGTFNQETDNLCRSFPVLEDYRGVVLHAESLKVLDNQYFKGYVKQPAAHTVLVVILDRIDLRTRFAKELGQQGILLACNKVKDEQSLKKVILREVQGGGGKITDGALSEFIRRMNYFQIADMNLMTVTGHLHSLLDISLEITEKLVSECCPQFGEPDPFGLSRLIEQGEMDALLLQAEQIPGERAIPVLALLLRSFRVAYKRTWLKEAEIGKNIAGVPFRRQGREQLLQCVRILTKTLHGIKTGTVQDAYALKLACARVACVLN